jgi:hypothetical protein
VRRAFYEGRTKDEALDVLIEAWSKQEGQLKDGSWRDVGPGYSDINDYAAGLNIGQFRPVVEERRKVVELFRQLAPAVSTRTLAKALGVSHQTVARDGGVVHDGPCSAKKSNDISKGVVHDGPQPMTGQQAARLVDRRERGAAERMARVQADERRVLALRPRPGKFRTIVLDPAWDFGHYAGGGFVGRAKPRYALQTHEELLALDVRAWAD